MEWRCLGEEGDKWKGGLEREVQNGGKNRENGGRKQREGRGRYVGKGRMD